MEFLNSLSSIQIIGLVYTIIIPIIFIIGFDNTIERKKLANKIAMIGLVIISVLTFIRSLLN